MEVIAPKLIFKLTIRIFTLYKITQPYIEKFGLFIMYLNLKKLEICSLQKRNGGNKS